MPVPLPPELVDAVVDHLHDDKLALATYSLLSHTWIPPSRFHLFHTIILRVKPGGKEFVTFLGFIRSTPGIADLIHELSLSSLVEVNWINDLPKWNTR